MSAAIKPGGRVSRLVIRVRGVMESNEGSQGHNTCNSTLPQHIYNNINDHPENDNSKIT